MIDLMDCKVQNAVQEYTGKHGGSFFYQEPGNEVVYENEDGFCCSFDNSISNDGFIACLNNNSLHFSLPLIDNSILY